MSQSRAALRITKNRGATAHINNRGVNWAGRERGVTARIMKQVSSVTCYRGGGGGGSD